MRSGIQGHRQLPTDELAVVVSMTRSLPPAVLAAAELIPRLLDGGNFVVRLLFAGSDNSTLITPIQAVPEALSVELVT